MAKSQMKNDIIKTLLVDDDEDDYLITKDLLSEINRANYKLDWVSTYGEALKIIARNQHDVYLIDYRLGEFSGLDLIQTAIENGCSVPMILLTGQGDSEVDIEAMKVGATDYLVKGQLDASSLERSIRYSIKSKQAEKAVRISEKRFRDIAFSSSDWIWEVDENGRYTYISENVIDVLGYKPEELIGKTPFDIMPEEEVEKIKEIFNKIAAQKNNIVDLVNWNNHKNGQLVCLQKNGVPIMDDGGNLLGYRGVDKNITERERAQQLLRQSEEKYRSLVENISDGVLTTDLNEKILFANWASCKISRMD
jgi:PAS domain S-box-containing protein